MRPTRPKLTPTATAAAMVVIAGQIAKHSGDFSAYCDAQMSDCSYWDAMVAAGIDPQQVDLDEQPDLVPLYPAMERAVFGRTVEEERC